MGGGLRRDDFPACQVWLSEGRPELDPRVGTGVNPSVFPLPTATCAQSALSQSNLSMYFPQGFARHIPSSNRGHSWIQSYIKFVHKERYLPEVSCIKVSSLGRTQRRLPLVYRIATWRLEEVRGEKSLITRSLQHNE